MKDAIMEALLNIRVTKSSDKSLEDSVASGYVKGKQALRDMDKYGNNIFKGLKKMFDSNPIISFAKAIKDTTQDLINLSSRQIEYQNNLITLKVAFGDTADEAENFANMLSKTVGFDSKDLIKSLALYRQYGNAMGYASETADLLAKNLVKMQLDLTAVYKDTDTYAVNFQRMGNALQNALTGQVKTIRGITGADITEATLEQTRLTLGITKSVQEMSRAEKTILIYLSLEQQLANTNGALSHTINSVSNQVAIFTSQLEIAKRQLGQLAYWILEKVLPIINGLLMTFNELIGMLIGFLGVNTKEADNFWKGQQKGADGYSSAIEKVNKQLRGFDKLNNISANDTSGISGGFGGGVSDEMLKHLEEYNLRLNEMQSNARDVRDALMSLFGFKAIYDDNGEFLKWEWSADTLFESWKKAILKALEKLGSFIKNNWEKLLIAGGLVLLFVGIKELFSKIGDASEKSATKVGKSSTIWAKAGKKFASAFKILATGGAILMILAGIAMVIEKLNDLMKTMGENGQTVGDVFKTLAGILSTLGIFLAVVVGLAKVLGSDPMALIGIIALVSNLVIILDVLALTLPTILDALGKFISTIAPTMIKLLQTIGDCISNIIKSLGEVLPPIIDSIGNAFEKVFSGIAKIIDSVANAIINVLDAILRFVRDVGPAINIFVDNIINAVTKLINFIISGIEYLINTLIIDSINSLLKQVKESKIAEILGFDKKVNLLADVSIRRFNPILKADGGFVKSGQVFIARENGLNEMVGNIGGHTAVANNDQIVEGITVGVARGMAQANNNQKVEIVAEGDASGLLDFITFKQREQQRQYGL